MQGKRNIQGKNASTVNAGETTKRPISNGTPSTKQGNKSNSNHNTFLQGCLGCLSILILIAIVVIVALVIMGKEDKPAEQQLPIQNSGTNSIATEGIDMQVRSLITKTLGDKTNTGEPKIINLEINDHYGTEKEDDKIVVATLHGNDNLNNSLMKGGMQLESIKLFKTLFEIPDIEVVALIWQFPTTNASGKVELNTVLKITITRATSEKIDWDSFNKDNFSKVSDNYWEHPTLRN